MEELYNISQMSMGILLIVLMISVLIVPILVLIYLPVRLLLDLRDIIKERKKLEYE